MREGRCPRVSVDNRDDPSRLAVVACEESRLASPQGACPVFRACRLREAHGRGDCAAETLTRSLTVSSSLLRCLLLGALAMPLLANAQIYKWIDQNGGTGYGQKPPRNAVKVTVLQADSNLSTIPLAIPREPQRQTQPAEAMWEARAVQFERIAVSGGFERPIAVPTQDAAAWRERCFAELRVDCSRPTDATFDNVPSFSPRDLSPFWPRP